MTLENIKIVLIEPQNPGNIGAAARAMKTMGLSHLVLIKPLCFPHKDAYIRSTNATDILENCSIADTLSEVISNCKLVIGTSTRDRGDFVPALTAREAAAKIVAEAKYANIALVFGTESHGMIAKDLRKCNYYAYIPANPDFSSLNLAAAVQTFCYEIFQEKEIQGSYKENADRQSTTLSKSYPSIEQLNYFYSQLEQLLQSSGFIRANHPGIIMDRLRALFNRARPDDKEINILLGILASIREKMR